MYCICTIFIRKCDLKGPVSTESVRYPYTPCMSDNYVDWSDLYVVLSDIYVDMSDLYVELIVTYSFVRK